MFKYLLCVCAFLPFAAQSQELFFTSYPCLSPDGKTVVFSYDNDLWKVETSGGTATRLTGMNGEETRAKFSPDGKWIAFTGTQNGNADVYIIPADGGAARQMTVHDSFDQVDNWSWDSKWIYFVSGMQNRFSGYKVAVDGGTPQRLFPNYFHTVHNIAERPNGELFFSETWESRNQAHRKRYKGSYNPDIQSYNAGTNVYKMYTTYNGKDMWPTIDRKGNVYYVSDEGNGEYNLYTLDGDKGKALTNFTSSIKNPCASADGNSVVFEKDFQLYLYDVGTNKTTKLNVKAITHGTIEKEKDFEVRDKITNFDVSADGKKLAFVSRGELFVSDLKGKFIRHIKLPVSGRSTEVKWMADNKTLIYAKTSANGFTNWYSVPADGVAVEKQWTNDDQNNRNLNLNADRTKGVYLSGRNEVRLLDLKLGTNVQLVKEEIWGGDNSSPTISPNGEYVMFTAFRNFEEDIFLYNIATEALVNLTNTGVTEQSPVWSPDGKYIYFTSNRIKPGYPYGLQDARVYRLALERIDDEFKSDQYRKLFEEKKDEPKKEEGKKEDSKKTETKPEPVKKYTLDLENVLERFELVSPAYGNQSAPLVFMQGEKTHVIYSSNHSDNTGNLYMTTYEPFEKTKTSKIEGAAVDYAAVLQAGEKYYALINGGIYTLNLDLKKADKIEIAFTFRKNLKEEFNQMYMETWANMKENFYSETFHGINWDTKRGYYDTYLKEVKTRADLRMLINNMLGELNASHTGFNSNGDEEKIMLTAKTMATGIRFKNDKPYVVESVVKQSAADKKGKNIMPGDELIKVNGVAVDAKRNRDEYFTHPSLDGELELTFKRGSGENVVKIHPQPSYEVNDLMYDEWIDANEKRVNEKSKERIGYVHMKGMIDTELQKFLVYMTSTGSYRDGLIVDLRYNTGGNVHNDVLQFLSQHAYMKWKYREGAYTMQPNFSPGTKPIVLLINEQSLSDAEVTSAGFKQLSKDKIINGKIIGMETYRWIIFTGGRSLVDGSGYRTPSWGCYTLDGKNLETDGVSPDIEVPMTFMDRLEGRDPQLDRAVEEILKELK